MVSSAGEGTEAGDAVEVAVVVLIVEVLGDAFGEVDVVAEDAEDFGEGGVDVLIDEIESKVVFFGDECFEVEHEGIRVLRMSREDCFWGIEVGERISIEG